MLLNFIKRQVLKRPTIELCARWPSTTSIRVMRRINEIQLSTEELKIIIAVVKDNAPCDLLVFGLGNDSIFWTKVNRGGNTVFIENLDAWFQEITAQDRGITAYLVDYHTQRKQWKELLTSPRVFDLELPKEVAQRQWDVVVVDAPGGCNDSTPGRMNSIALASQLVKVSGDVFVHDCDREVEGAYCDQFLGNENLSVEVGVLRHYHIASRRL